MKNKHKYRLKYKLERPVLGSFTAEEITKEYGATDALFMASIIYPEDGSLSIAYSSWDGRNEGKELSPRETFKLWSMLALDIERKSGLDPDGWQAQVVKSTNEIIKAMIFMPSKDDLTKGQPIKKPPSEVIRDIDDTATET